MNHYDFGQMPTITIIKSKMSREQYNGFCLGNVYKYITRAEHKGEEISDLTKAMEYLKWLIESKKETENAVIR